MSIKRNTIPPNTKTTEPAWFLVTKTAAVPAPESANPATPAAILSQTDRGSPSPSFISGPSSGGQVEPDMDTAYLALPVNPDGEPLCEAKEAEDALKPSQG